jgi:hypothetical protein
MAAIGARPSLLDASAKVASSRNSSRSALAAGRRKLPQTGHPARPEESGKTGSGRLNHQRFGDLSPDRHSAARRREDAPAA